VAGQPIGLSAMAGSGASKAEASSGSVDDGVDHPDDPAAGASVFVEPMAVPDAGIDVGGEAAELPSIVPGMAARGAAVDAGEHDDDELAATTEMDVVAAGVEVDRQGEAPAAAEARHFAGGGAFAPRDLSSDENDDDGGLPPLLTRGVLALLGLVLIAALGAVVAAIVLPKDDGDKAEAGDGQPASQLSPSTSTTEAPSTTAATTTTVAPTTTAAPTTVPPTAPPTTKPQPTTTATPPPVVDGFDVDIQRRGCDRGASPATFHWQTSGATTVTLGRIGGQAQTVDHDGSFQTCVSDLGESWRLSVSGPGGTVTRDLRAAPYF